MLAWVGSNQKVSDSHSCATVSVILEEVGLRSRKNVISIALHVNTAHSVAGHTRNAFLEPRTLDARTGIFVAGQQRYRIVASGTVPCRRNAFAFDQTCLDLLKKRVLGSPALCGSRRRHRTSSQPKARARQVFHSQ